MMKTKSTSASKPPTAKPKRVEATSESVNGVLPSVFGEVLTLSEAAAFLRAAEVEVRKLADAAQLPARRVGGEWRFLKSALCAWLSQPEPVPVLSSKERMLALAGVWKDDETVDEMVEAIYRERKRHPVGGE